MPRPRAPPTPSRSARTPASAIAPATGIAIRSDGEKLGVRPSNTTTTEAVSAIATHSAPAPAQERRADLTRVSTPPAASAAIAGASALT